jgi:hypothetical protein
MDFDFEDSNTFDVADLFGGDVASSGVDLSALGTDLQELDLSNLFSNSDGQGVDFSGLDNLDISSLLSGGDNFMPGDFGRSLADELASTSLSTGRASSLFSDDGGFSMNALFRNATDGIDTTGLDAGDTFDVSKLLKSEGGEGSLNKSLSSTEKDTSGGTGLKATGRGQLSMVDPITGATGITGEGFTSLKDLLGSGTAEEIARYTPGTADYGLKSGLDTEGGQGFSADSTRGMSLENMGGGQGLSKYIPAEYSESALSQLVKNNPGAFPDIEKYLDSQYDKAGLTPFKGTGGTLSETGFLSQSSAANPLGSKYSLGDPKSFINNPTITGQQSVVSPNRTIIDNKDGTFKVVTNTIDGTKTITTTKEGVDKIIRETKTIDNTKTTNPGAAAKAADKKDNNMLMMLLALMAMMNKGGGSSTGSGGTIPSLQANRSQLPYGPISGSQARPGAGGVNYFSPTSYTQKAAGGGMMYGGGGISDLGGYSDGGRLLRGPGDGVSDSIPATIGGKQPARLAEGEFVVPARVVSELGNGSTEAGAKKLYAMMDRVQKARRKTKNVAADTKAHKYLPA